MEILSTGEKIKRARIYKGLTLKEICKDKISVSKMSCVENDKVKLDRDTLSYVAKILGISEEYLIQDVKAQLIINLDNLKKDKTGDYEGKLEYNLGFSQKFKYYDITFKLMHLLFKYYLDNGKLENIEVITAKYYETYQKSDNTENRISYSMDMAQYFYLNKEYTEAANYLNNVRKFSEEIKDYKTLAHAIYDEAACYMMMENYDRAYEIGVRLKEYMNYFDKSINKAKAYEMLAMLSLRVNKDKFHGYEKLADSLYSDKMILKSNANFNYASIMFNENMKDEALKYIDEAYKSYPQDNLYKYEEFLLLTIEELIKNKIFEKADYICDEALNCAIKLDNVRSIEKAYYYKAIILQKKDKPQESEVYMTLSLDALLKFGNKAELYKRYIEMGSMYYKIKNIGDSIKYFNFAIQLKDKM